MLACDGVTDRERPLLSAADGVPVEDSDANTAGVVVWLPLRAWLPVAEADGGTGDEVAGNCDVAWLAVGVEELPRDAAADAVCEELAVTEADSWGLPEAVADAKGLLGLGSCEEL